MSCPFTVGAGGVGDFETIVVTKLDFPRTRRNRVADEGGLLEGISCTRSDGAPRALGQVEFTSWARETHEIGSSSRFDLLNICNGVVACWGTSDGGAESGESLLGVGTCINRSPNIGASFTNTDKISFGITLEEVSSGILLITTAVDEHVGVVRAATQGEVALIDSCSTFRAAIHGTHVDGHCFGVVTRHC